MLASRLPLVVYCVESIFEYEYLREYKAKIDNTLTLVWGPYGVLLGANNSKIGFAGLSL